MKSNALNRLSYGETDAEVFATENDGYLSVARDENLANPLREWETLASYLTWERNRLSPQENDYRGPEELFEELSGEEAGEKSMEEMAHRLREKGFLCEVVYRSFDGIGLSDMPYATTRPWPVGFAYVPFASLAAEGVDENQARAVMSADLAAWSSWAEGDVWQATEYDENGVELSCSYYYGLDDLETAYPSLRPAAAADKAKIEGRPFIDPKGNVLLASFDRPGSILPDALIFRPCATQQYVVASGYDAEKGEWSQGSYFDDPMRAWAAADPEIFEESLVVWRKDDIRGVLEDEGMPGECIDAAAANIAFNTRNLSDWKERAVQEKNEEIVGMARAEVEARALDKAGKTADGGLSAFDLAEKASDAREAERRAGKEGSGPGAR